MRRRAALLELAAVLAVLLLVLLAGCSPSRVFASAEHIESHQVQYRLGAGWDAGNGHEVGAYWAPRQRVGNPAYSDYPAAVGAYWEWRR